MPRLGLGLGLKSAARLGGNDAPPAGQQFETITDTNGVEQPVTVTDINGVEQRITVSTGLS